MLSSFDHAKMVLREVSILRRLRHAHVLRLRDVFLRPSDTGGFSFRGGQLVPNSVDVYIATEYCDQVRASVRAIVRVCGIARYRRRLNRLQHYRYRLATGDVHTKRGGGGVCTKSSEAAMCDSGGLHRIKKTSRSQLLQWHQTAVPLVC